MKRKARVRWRGPRVGEVGEEGVEDVEEVAAIAESREFVGLGLSMALFGQDAQVSRRERESQPDDHERGRRQTERRRG